MGGDGHIKLKKRELFHAETTAIGALWPGAVVDDYLTLKTQAKRWCGVPSPAIPALDGKGLRIRDSRMTKHGGSAGPRPRLTQRGRRGN